MRRRALIAARITTVIALGALVACSVTVDTRTYHGAAAHVREAQRDAPSPAHVPVAAESRSEVDASPLAGPPPPTAAVEPSTESAPTVLAAAVAAQPAGGTATGGTATGGTATPALASARAQPRSVPSGALAATVLCAPEALAQLPAATAALSPQTGTVTRPMLVQIDNAIPARPPLHLSEAVTVYESVAEGGVTRFSALFNRDDVGVVGPVRSARLISIEVARQFDALLVYHGASTGVQNFIWDGGIHWVSFNVPDTAPIQSRLASRPVPHNSVTFLPQVRAYARAHGIADTIDAGRDFPRGDAPVTVAGTPVTRFSVGFANPDGAPFPGYRGDFTYDDALGRYVRAIGGVPHVDGASGQRISAETVVVQVAPVVVTDIVEDILGSRSLDYHLVGAGQAFFLRGGQRWEGCWYRPDSFAMTRYILPDGSLFPFGDGPIWVAMAMPNTVLRWNGF